MAKKIRKIKTAKKPKINSSEIQTKNGFFSRIKLTESYTSLILGAIVVLVIGILFIFFAKGNRNAQTSSVNTEPENQSSNTSSTYTVMPGDDLWTISQNVYNDGFKWVEIAKLNKLENPDLIHSGDKLTIATIVPNLEQREIVAPKPEQNPQLQNSVIKNNSITKNSYTVVKGDNLWDIAVRAYGDGFRWPEIAKANNLVNPSLIHPGNIFKIPR